MNIQHAADVLTSSHEFEPIAVNHASPGETAIQPTETPERQQRRFLEYLRSAIGDDAVFDLRFLRSQFDRNGFIVPDERYGGTIAGSYSDLDAAIADAGKAKGVSVYVTINPVSRDMLARSCNRVTKQKNVTADEDIVRCIHVLIDIDSIRRSGISANDDELSAAVALRDEILGRFPQIRDGSHWGVSGNGGWILLRIKPLDTEAYRRAAAALLALLGGLDTDRAKVDQSTKNPARIMGLVGTRKCKGDPTPGRPHRYATLDSPGREPEPVDLEEFIAAHPVPSKPPSDGRPAAPIAPALPPPGGADPIERARAYLARMAPAISGQNGHGQTFDAACALVKGFGLSVEQARPVFDEWNQRCEPPWSPAEIEHKLRSADEKPDDRPRGYLLPGKPSYVAPAASPSPLPGSATQASGAADQCRGQEEDSHRLARLFLGGYNHPDGPTLWRWQGEFWTWQGSYYREVTQGELHDEVTGVVEREFARIYELDMERWRQQADAAQAAGEKPPKEPRKRSVGTRLIGDVIQAVRSLSSLPVADTPSQPAWIGEPVDGWGPRDILPAKNGLIHLPSFIAGRDYLIPHTPAFFNAYAVDYDVVRGAAMPYHWCRFLASIFPDSPESVETLQEIFGCILCGDLSHQKIFMLLGPPRSGKGTIAAVLRKLIGETNTCNPTLAGLATNFGASALIGKPLAVVGDCRISGRTDKAAIVEKLLSISGGDAQTIDRKFREPISLVLPTQFLVLSNEFPALRDQSGAFISRLLIIATTISFLGREDKGLFGRLLPELSGIAEWAIEGWKRLRERGHVIQPDLDGLLEEIEDVSSPVKAFIRDCCILDPAASEGMDNLFAAWERWNESRKMQATNRVHFSRALRSAAPGIQKVHLGSNGARVHGYRGLRLTNSTDATSDQSGGEINSDTPF
jgi:putative DNA primase/helicase